LKAPPQGGVGDLCPAFRAGAANVGVAVLAWVVDPVRKSMEISAQGTVGMSGPSVRGLSVTPLVDI